MYGEVVYDALSDALRCELCGKWFKGLGYHIYNKHKMTTDQYKKQFGLDRNQSLIADELRDHRSRLVRENGTIENLKAGKKTQFKKGKDERREFQRRAQSKHRLKQQSLEYKKQRKQNKLSNKNSNGE